MGRIGLRPTALYAAVLCRALWVSAVPVTIACAEAFASFADILDQKGLGRALPSLPWHAFYSMTQPRPAHPAAQGCPYRTRVTPKIVPTHTLPLSARAKGSCA